MQYQEVKWAVVAVKNKVVHQKPNSVMKKVEAHVDAEIKRKAVKIMRTVEKRNEAHLQT